MPVASCSKQGNEWATASLGSRKNTWKQGWHAAYNRPQRAWVAHCDLQPSQASDLWSPPAPTLPRCDTDDWAHAARALSNVVLSRLTSFADGPCGHDNWLCAGWMADILRFK